MCLTMAPIKASSRINQADCQHVEHDVLGVRLRHDGTYDVRTRCRACEIEILFCGCYPTAHQYDVLCEAGGAIDFEPVEFGPVTRP